jgi:hypothetical protein
MDRRRMRAMQGPKVLRGPQEKHSLGRPVIAATTVPDPMEQEFVPESAGRHRPAMRTVVGTNCPEHAHVE